MHGGTAFARAGTPPMKKDLFLLNLALLVGGGVAACAWMIRYTDWFPAVGGVLALGGAFSWIAFISGILSEERKARVQEVVGFLLLDNWVATVLLVLLIATGAVWAMGASSVELVSLQETPALIACSATGAAMSDTLMLEAHGSTRVAVRTGLAGTRVIRLRLRGLPELPVTVRPRERLTVQVPYSFMRPVVLLRPASTIFKWFANRPGTLHLRRNGVDSTSIKGFTGQAVWIGCGADVELPDFLRDRWSAESETLAAGQRAAWIYPAAIDSGPKVLAAGDILDAWLTTSKGAIYRTQRYVVRRVGRDVRDFPQVEEF